MSGLKGWLAGAAWPLWLAHGVDWQAGAFEESLTLDRLDCPLDYRRLRVAARQVYVFAQAHRHGLPRAAGAVELGVDFLRRRAALPGGGYAWRFDRQGRVTDARIDLYDQAFVLLALSAATAILPAAALRGPAMALDDFIESAMAHPAGGYVESLPPGLPRRQNPHMHLLEARLAAAEAFGETCFLERATPLVALFRERFLRGGALLEFFGEDWRAAEPAVVEPGHHCEWIWLLHRHARLTRGPVPAEAAILQDFVDRHGEDASSGALRDALAPDGRVLEAGARLWPQTERLKSEALRRPFRPERLAAAEAALSAYLRPDGLWHERRLPGGAFSTEAAPASSLYHLTCGILEAAALAPR
ncbi:AGE family epimerase/isomerase [Roseomonas marmotae]|uniref:AGE family epimerase/isomerase n=1 Tax=Roseomonas marmotae TaxID=2768161 RepID=A0ABS3K6Q8_9PROT|nr:AGE family epimerase/isomerase [Roseomonas marmotae]MBO1073134.1 AGE family epimerase/isomerase [Roseomonas marmotae]QTI79230.1 AGE family epimerase/isomerase [Roseomonas marmotae]